MAQKLINYLAQLNTTEVSWSLWVNPEDFDDYRIVENTNEAPEGFFRVGTLESLSFGQSESEVIASLLESGEYSYKGRKVLVNAEVISDCYFGGTLDRCFDAAIAEDIEYICKNSSLQEAEYFVSIELPALLIEADTAMEEVCESYR